MKKDDFFKEAENFYRIKNALKESGKKITVIKRKDDLFLLFVYDRKMLEKTLNSSDVISFLEEHNYKTDAETEAILRQLFRRLTQKAFPHEIGLFLGYPLEDVKGFEASGGKNCKFQGSWAVYGDVNKSTKLMKTYSECTECCLRLMKMGIKTEDMETYFKREKLLSA